MIGYVLTAAFFYLLSKRFYLSFLVFIKCLKMSLYFFYYPTLNFFTFLFANLLI